MNRNTPILECVPNFSEGRDENKIQAIASAIRAVSGVSLLHIDTSPAANRTVITFAGAPQSVADAAFAAIATAAEVIDMSQQIGVHPRIGATDVCPFVPLSNMTLQEANEVAAQVGSHVGNDLNIPVYLYEYSAKAAHRRALPDIRKGQYEGFAEKMLLPEWAPDYGPAVFRPATGATVLGARKVLVAFNVSLDTADVDIASKIATRMRTRGYRNIKGEKVPGMFRHLRAIGWYMADYGNAQVSFNLLDYTQTSPLTVFNACRDIAAEFGVGITGSEVIGLLPEACLLEAGSVPAAISHMKLDALKPFHPDEKVLEYALRKAGIFINSIANPAV